MKSLWMKNALLIQIKERKGLKIPRQQRVKSIIEAFHPNIGLDTLSLPFIDIEILFILRP